MRLLTALVAIFVMASVGFVVFSTEHSPQDKADIANDDIEQAHTSVSLSTKIKITDVIPEARLGLSSASWITTSIRDVKDKVTYTIEGTILEFGEPILYTGPSNNGGAAIPVTMSVEKIHKGDLESDKFTFFLGSMVQLHNRTTMSETIKLYPGIDYTNVKKSYIVSFHHELFEIGDKIIAHFAKGSDLSRTYIYEKDVGTLAEHYYIKLGPYAVFPDVLAQSYSNAVKSPGYGGGTVCHIPERTQV